MSGSHEKLPWLFWVQLVLVAIVAVLFFMLRPTGHGGEHGGGAEHEASSQALKPIGEVAVSSDATSSGAAGRTGKEVVEKTCQSCHAHGVANAPKMDDSAKAAWEARLANGMDAVLEVAKTGKGAMPPMGADPSLTDAELKDAIVYMMEKAGVDTSSLSGSSAAAPKAEATPASKPEVTPVSAPAAEAKPAEAEDMGKAPEAPSAPVAPEPPASAETVSSDEAPVAEAAAVAVVAAPEAEAKPSIDGAKLYSTTCFACHDTGAAGAPKTGDKAVWEARIAAGTEILYESAIKGKASAAGVMPPKGGYMNLTDDEVKAMVDYMVSKSQ